MLAGLHWSEDIWVTDLSSLWLPREPSSFPQWGPCKSLEYGGFQASQHRGRSLEASNQAVVSIAAPGRGSHTSGVFYTPRYVLVWLCHMNSPSDCSTSIQTSYGWVMDIEPSSETAERGNEVHKGWNSGTNGCEVTKERKEGKQNNMKGAQFAINIIESNTKSL